MSRFSLGWCAVVLIAALSNPVMADAPKLGQPAGPARIAAWDLDVSPDGSGLPPGQGSVAEGARIFTARCATCHSLEGRGGTADRLTGGIGSLTSERPVKTVASYWPYATTLFGFIRIAMPITKPRSLTPSEVYALCAYLLSIDGIVPKDAVLDRTSLPAVVMPNRNGFTSVWKATGAKR